MKKNRNRTEERETKGKDNKSFEIIPKYGIDLNSLYALNIKRRRYAM